MQRPALENEPGVSGHVDIQIDVLHLLGWRNDLNGGYAQRD
jgi:hypothetical protein